MTVWLNQDTFQTRRLRWHACGKTGWWWCQPEDAMQTNQSDLKFNANWRSSWSQIGNVKVYVSNLNTVNYNLFWVIMRTKWQNSVHNIDTNFIKRAKTALLENKLINKYACCMLVWDTFIWLDQRRILLNTFNVKYSFLSKAHPVFLESNKNKHS